ncbi:MAG: MarR family transcriptional regulator [Dehalogenimonas sp.]|uniref:MarR family transcriptional regulator n=1 Tax=Candidatus Dehalogenimonas loeffleri TaxID=3127115 RepID=A0ABZ2J4Q7_9CHLR|nr:MarR family transcriptional regulator [Dehalogenimonas sp.]
MKRFHSLKRLMAPDTQAAAGEGLAHSQWLALHLVSENEGIGIKELAGLLGITSSAATQLVESLVCKGLLTRQQSLDDRRALILSLPEASRQQVEAVRQQRLEQLNQVFGVLDDAEFEILSCLVDKIVNSKNTEKR